MKIIQQTYHIKAPLEEVWQALTQKSVIEKWGGGPAHMDGKKGTKFTLWGGDIHGTNTEVVPLKKLVQDWYGGDWEKPSQVVFVLTPVKEGVQLVLTHTGAPENEIKDLDSGWKDYYLGPLKSLLEKKGK